MTITGSGRKESIHDEDFLEIPHTEKLRCPELKRIYEAFYSDPIIYPNQSRSIVAELELLNITIFSKRLKFAGSGAWEQTYQRLKNFFSEAWETGSMIECQSD
ncbi:MAG: hypothetical protein JWM59_3692 [Verrucomicrobiales bacterium]|nr:hypothetical protein [Verrucomicrobiales bacterium]